MIVKPIADPLANEHVLQVEPRMAPLGVDAGWRRRANLFTGRALSADALAVEQGERAGRLALLGQHLSAGVVAGLEARLETSTQGPLIHLSPGVGIGVSGEDVVIRRQLVVPLSKIPFFGGDKDADLFVLEALANGPGGPPAGVQAAILTLVPTTSMVEPATSPVDSCEVDTGDAAFVDKVKLEGAALVLVGWPSTWTMPDSPSRKWRSRLVNAIFEREHRRRPGSLNAWEQIGVPLALLGFDEAGAPKFIDRHAVVRQGGVPLPRTPLVHGRGAPVLWQARILQFSEQLASLGAAAIADGSAIRSFRRLPPVGVLPKDAIDYREWTCRFFPNHFQLEAVPVPFEQLDSIARASASLETLDLTRPERVRILVPVPASVYEPRLLLDEPLDPAFIDAIEEGLTRLGLTLKRRQVVRGRMNVLKDTIYGEQPDRYPAVDPEADPDEARYIPAELPDDSPEAGYDTEDGAVTKAVALLQNRFSPPWEQAIDVVSTQLAHPVKDEVLRHEFQGQLTSAPVAVSQGNRAHVFARGPFRTLWYRTFDGKTWGHLTSVLPVTSGIQIKSAPGAAISPRGRLDVFFRDAALAHNLQTAFIDTRANNPVWSIPRVVANGCYGTPAAVYLVDGHADVFYVGAERALWHVAVTRTGSSRPVAVVKDRYLVTDPVLAVCNGQIEVFAVDKSNEVVQVSLGEKTIVTPHSPGVDCRWVNVCASKPGQMELLIVDGGGTLWHRHFEAGKWGAFSVVGGGITLIPALTATEDGSRVDMVVRTVSGRLQHTWFDGSWHPLEALGTEPSQNSPAVIRRGGDVDALIRGREGLLWRRPVVNSSTRIYHSQGLQGLAQDLAVRLGKVDEAVDAAFLRVQTEIHRIRQLMLGNSASSVLSTSPVLSQIAQAEVRTATQADVTTFVTGLTRKVSFSTTVHADPNSLKDQLLKINPVIDTLQGALSTKRDLLSRILGLISGMDFDLADVLLPDVKPPPWTASRFVQAAPAPSVSIIPPPEVRVPVPLRDLERLSSEDWQEVFKDYVSPKVPARTQESTYFSMAIAQLEDLLNALRGIEERVGYYQSVVAEAGGLIVEFKGQEAAGDARLATLAREIDEERQDLVVARALLTEEQSRLAEINERRERVRREHVRFLVYQRPRMLDMERPTPTRALDTGLYESALPAALAETRAAPPELWTLINVLRDAPVGWFANGPVIHRGLDRLDLVVRALSAAKVRAQLHVPVAPPAINRAPSRYGDGVVRALDAQNQVIARSRALTATLDIDSLSLRGWAELQSLSLPLITFGDLAAGGHGRTDVAQFAAQEVEKISKVATYLHVLFGQVAPRIRLDWAEILSEYDAPFDLQVLSRLPRWNEIESTDRRHLQELVDWLFKQLNLSVPEALSLMNDVVRTAILLASHAPVDEIVSGHLPRPTPAKIGGLLELVVDPTRIRVGMHVLLSTSEHTVQAVVEDLSLGSARARVFSATAEVVPLAEKTVAKFSEPSHPGSLLPLPRNGLLR